MKYRNTSFADEVICDMTGFEAEIAEMIRQDEVEESACSKKIRVSIPSRESVRARKIRARKKAIRKNRRNRGNKFFKFDRSRIEYEERVRFSEKRNKSEATAVLISEFYEEEEEKKQQEIAEEIVRAAKDFLLFALEEERDYYVAKMSYYQEKLAECDALICDIMAED